MDAYVKEHTPKGRNNLKLENHINILCISQVMCKKNISMHTRGIPAKFKLAIYTVYFNYWDKICPKPNYVKSKLINNSSLFKNIFYFKKLVLILLVKKEMIKSC